MIAPSFAFNNSPPVYFRFGIHRNPIIVVNAFNSPVSRRAAPSDALLIIGMTNAISGRAPRKRAPSVEKRGREGRFVSDVAVFFPNGANISPACRTKRQRGRRKRANFYAASRGRNNEAVNNGGKRSLSLPLPGERAFKNDRKYVRPADDRNE